VLRKGMETVMVSNVRDGAAPSTCQANRKAMASCSKSTVFGRLKLIPPVRLKSMISCYYRSSEGLGCHTHWDGRWCCSHTPGHQEIFFFRGPRGPSDARWEPGGASIGVNQEKANENTTVSTISRYLRRLTDRESSSNTV